MPTSDLHDLTSAWRGLFRTLRVFRKELPFAGYSVVKDPASTAFGSVGEASRFRVTCQDRGGEYRARTGDLLVANQALSQLS